MSMLLWSVTQDQVTRYTEGDCWLLAFELGRLLQAPLVSLGNPASPDDWDHVAVDLGCETLLDAVGLHFRDDLRRDWEKRSSGPVVFRELGFFHSMDSYLQALDGERLAAFVSRRDEEDALQFANEITQALTEAYLDFSTGPTEGRSIFNDHLHSWATWRRQEQMGA